MMAIKFNKGVDTLKHEVNCAGIKGKWFEDGKGKHTFKSERGGVLNFWPHNSTVQFQGKAGHRAELEKIFSSRNLTSELKVETKSQKEKTKILGIIYDSAQNRKKQLDADAPWAL